MPISGYFDEAFGNAGTLGAIPDALQVDGSVSYNQGWGIDYTLPSSNPSYKYMPWGQFNQLFYDITSAIQKIQQGSAPAFITSAMNGGSAYIYPKYAMVSLGGVTYVSNQAANGDTPPSAKWNVFNIATPGVPYSIVTGNTQAFAAGQLGNYVSRSNATVAMADTLPNGGGSLDSGWFAYVENNDASASLTISSAGTIKQGNLTGSVIILPGELWLLESEGAGVYRAQRISAATLHASPVGGNVKNLKSTWNSTTQATISADEIVLEDANGNTRRISTVSQQYAVGTSGAGGIDTGAIAANTWYYEYLAFNPTTGAKTAFISLSATAPTLPAGYTFYKATGEMRTDGSSHIIGKQQNGKKIQYLVGSNLSAALQMISGSSGNVTTPTWTAQSVSNFVPPTATRIQGYLGALLGSPSIGAIAAPNNSYGGSQSSITNYPPCVVEGTSASGNGGSVSFDWILETTNVYYASAATTAALFCTGWETSLIGS